MILYYFIMLFDMENLRPFTYSFDQNSKYKIQISAEFCLFDSILVNPKILILVDIRKI